MVAFGNWIIKIKVYFLSIDRYLDGDFDSGSASFPYITICLGLGKMSNLLLDSYCGLIKEEDGSYLGQNYSRIVFHL